MTALYDRYAQRGVNFAFGLLRNQSDSEDVVHDAFSKLMAPGHAQYRQDRSGMTHELPERSVSERMISVDALRGFNMIWIIGVAEIAYKLHELYGHPLTAFVDKQLKHPSWDEGFTFYDLIWPLFLFIVGVVLPESLERRRQRGHTTKQLYFYIVRRTVIVFFVGVLIGGPLSYDLSSIVQVKWWGVLQRIAVCYLVAAILTMHTSWRTQVGLVVAILAGYWAALMHIEIGGYGPGVGSRDDCWVYAFGLPDNFVTTPMSLPSVLFGVWAGRCLGAKWSPGRKTMTLALAGIVLVGVGYTWSLSFPMIKRIWSSTYVLFAGGWSCLLLTWFYWIIDVKGYRKWAFFFVVIGSNALLIYFLTHGHTIIDFEWIARLFLQSIIETAGATREEPIMLMSAALAVKWLFLWYLYRHRVLVKA